MMNIFIHRPSSSADKNRPSSSADKIKHLRLFEISFYGIILVTTLGIPFFWGAYTNFGWKGVWIDWVRLLPFVLIFLASNYLLVPKLLFREKYLWYVVACMLSAILAVYLSGFLFEATRRGLTTFEGFPPSGRMAPPSDVRVPPSGSMAPPEVVKLPPSGSMAPPPFGMSKPPFGFAAGRGRPPFPFFNFGTAIIAFLLIGFNTGIKSFVRWSEEKVRQAEKDRQYYFTELAFLKHQISPHFFMNTLNNIHALVDINAQEAKNAIIKMSYLMRYLLYESDEQKVSLRKEIDFIESYIELMRLRYDDDTLTIETAYPDNVETVYVPSSLFLSFIENAFKHGVNPHDYSLIKISFSIESDRLTFNIINNRWDVTVYQTETTGIGLENVRKRLDLIYRGDYTLDIQSSDKLHIVNLKIPIS